VRNNKGEKKMSYEAEISRANPSCIVFLIDQSESMVDPWGGESGNQQKAQGVADAINKLLSNLIIKSTKSDGLRNYFDVGVIGYGASVGNAFTGTLKGRDLVSIQDIGNNVVRVEKRMKKMSDGAGGIITQEIDFAVWFDPVANGRTPMCSGLEKARQILADWVQNHSSAYPPMIINITDGLVTDGDPTQIAQSIMKLSTDDGNTLIYNCHISGESSAKVVFPDNDSGLPGQYAQMLFNMSSILPEKIRGEAQKLSYAVSPQTRGFAFNTDLVDLIQFLDIGTKKLQDVH
jgi:hypothetical protein